MESPSFEYRYRCLVSRVIDGDTVVCDVDLGFGVWVRGVVFRMYGMNAPEMKGLSREKGLASKGYLEDIFERSGSLGCTVVTYKDKREKYGRMLGVFYVGDEMWSVNSQMIDSGMAIKFMGDL